MLLTIINTNNLHTVVQFQELLSDTNNFQVDIFVPLYV